MRSFYRRSFWGVFWSAALVFSCSGESSPPKGEIPTKQDTPDTRPPEVAAKEELVAALKAQNMQIRLTAARALSRLNIPFAKVALAEALYDPHPVIRTFAAASLARQGDLSGLTLLEEALKNAAGPQARALAVTAMRHLPPETSIPRLSACMEEEDRSFLTSCAAALAFLKDPKGEATLREVLTQPEHLRSLAFHLRFLPEEVGVPLLSALLEQGDKAREVIPTALVSAARWKEGMSPLLRKALASPDLAQRGVAAASLLARGEEADPAIVAAALSDAQGREALSALAKRLEEPDTRLLSVVPLALSVVPNGFPFAFTLLDTFAQKGVFLQDPAPLLTRIDEAPPLIAEDAQSQAASSPTKAPNPADYTKEKIQEMLSLKTAATLAIAHLANMNHPRGQEMFPKLLDWPLANQGLVGAIQSLRGDASFPLLVMAAKHPDYKARLAAAKALARELSLGREDARATLEPLLKDESASVRIEALLALRDFPKEDAINLARPALQDLSGPVRVAAAFVILASLHPEGTVPSLEEEMDGSTPPEENHN